MKVGFTGTRQGVNELQEKIIYSLLREFQPTECHHGDCKGADETFHKNAKLFNSRIIAHPAESMFWRAKCDVDEVRIGRYPLIRNHEIAEEIDVLIAAPKTEYEEKRSGTWATVRYTRKLNKPIYLVFPDGTLRTENI